jgi:hypothetical protein
VFFYLPPAAPERKTEHAKNNHINSVSFADPGGESKIA